MDKETDAKKWATLRVDKATAGKVKVYAASRGSNIHKCLKELIDRETNGWPILFEGEK